MHAALVEERSRRLSWGQDTSQLYLREDGAKRWRAEYPATDDDKLAGKTRLALFENAVGALEQLKLGECVHAHVQLLEQRLVACQGRGQAGGQLRQRLQMVREAQHRLGGLRVVHKPEFVIAEPTRYFLTYVRDEPTGTRTPMRTKPRLTPYDVGRVHGASPRQPAHSTHLHAFVRISRMHP